MKITDRNGKGLAVERIGTLWTEGCIVYAIRDGKTLRLATSKDNVVTVYEQKDDPDLAKDGEHETVYALPRIE